MTVVTQKSFSGGVMGPMMLGRSDDTKYQAGLKTCRNFIVLPQGAVQNRAGFKHVRECKYADKPVRLIPFTFSRDQTMILEFGHKYVRFHTQGATLLNDNGTPYEIASQYDADDVMELHYVQSADVLTFVHHNYPPTELRRYSVRDWRFEKINFNPTIDAPTGVTAVKATSAQDEINADKYTFKYCVTALNADRTIQSERSSVVSCTANIYNTGTTVKISWNAVSGASFYRVYRNEGGVYAYLGETEELSIIDDNIDPDADYTPPRREELFTTSKGIDSVTVTNGGSGYGTTYTATGVEKIGKSQLWTLAGVQVVTSVSLPHKMQGYIISEDGSRVEYGSSVRSVVGDGKGATVKVEHDGITVKSITLVTPGSGYTKGSVTIEAFLDIMGEFMQFDLAFERDLPTAYVTDSTGRGSELKVTCNNGKVEQITVSKHGYDYSNPTVVITGKNGTGATATATVKNGDDYPQCATYFEQRRVFASTPNEPQGIWMSKSGTDSDFSYCIPVRSDDRVKFKIASRERHEVRHLVPLNRLIVLTEAGEWVVTSANSDAITPTSVQLKAQSFVGANMVQPLIINNTVLYAASRGGHVRELGYNYNAGGYVTADVSIRASHLFDNYEIVDASYAKAPWPIAWWVNSNGSLLGLTYVPDQQIAAWHEHTTQGGVFEAVACVAENKIDAVYVVTRRMVNGSEQRFIERMAEREVDTDEDAFFVDNGGTYKGDPTKTISGLTWLEGERVSILADGAEMPQQVVKDGRITLPVEARTVHVGLPIDAEIQTLPVTIPLKDGSDGGSLTKNVNKVFMRVYRSSGIFIGPEDGELVEFRQRTTEQPGSPPTPVTGGIDVDLQPHWTDSGSVILEQKSPLPLTILSIAANMELGG